jgi:hypothetical protein
MPATLATGVVGTARNPGWMLTQTRLSATATFVGLLPSGIVVTSFVLGSIRASVPLPPFATQTAPAPAAMSLGLRPMPSEIVAATLSN